MIIFRHLAKEVLTTMLGITLLALVILITNQSVRFLHYAAAGGLPTNGLIDIILLQIPLLLGYLLPLGFYLAILLSLARMYFDSEMVVLSACGVSRFQVMKMVLTLACCLALFVFWLMAYALPKAQRQIDAIYTRAAAHATISEIMPRRFMVFNSSNRHIVFYADRVNSDTHILHGVFLSSTLINPKASEKNDEDVVVAKRAYEKKMPGSTEAYLVFDTGYRYQGIPGQKDYRVTKFKQMQLSLPMNNASHENNDPSSMRFSELIKMTKNNPKASAELQWRFAMPITVIIFALLAVPLSEVPPRYGKFTQLFPAMLIYLAYADGVMYARGAIGSGKIPVNWGMWWIHGAGFALALVLISYRSKFFWARLFKKWKSA